MADIKVRGAAFKVNPKDVSPAWKTLQMNLKEEEADAKNNNLRKEAGSYNHDAASSSLKPSLCHKRSSDIPVLRHEKIYGEATPVLALDCEYVGGGTNGNDDLLARVSIINQEGKIVFDKYVKPRERVTDFRSSVSGIRPEHIANGSPFDVVQREVARILKDRIIVGHSLNNDFRVLNLHHNRKLTRDTAKCALLRKMANCNGVPSLKRLANAILGIEIQQGEHDSVIDARVALRLYLTVKKKWESDIKRFRY